MSARAYSDFNFALVGSIVVVVLLIGVAVVLFVPGLEERLRRLFRGGK